ncbi:unnamed protein product [Prorocentrum cordatum]|uniref:LTD domain-containing protein n=1 Tax=Prorocentrum cordatum TaxID=2364126 RepID=A0ABN9TIS8_9DINO|nr:unnamed protein product [Polarella glacialis]
MQQQQQQQQQQQEQDAGALLPAGYSAIDTTSLWTATRCVVDAAASRRWPHMFFRGRLTTVMVVLAMALVASAAVIGRPRRPTGGNGTPALRTLATACAGSGPLVINEVVPDPSGSGKEWVEVYNPTSNSMDVSGWKLVEKTGSAGRWVSSTIPACSYAIVEFSRKLNNGGDALTLIDESGSTVDVFKYTSSVIGKSWARQPDGGAWGLEPQSPSRSKQNPAAPSADDASRRGCAQCDDGLCLGSWNIQNFGASKGGRPAVMAAIRSVMGRYDVAAVQELSQMPREPFVCGDNTESTICASRPSEDGYTVAASPRIGDEQYAVILRDAAARPVRGATYPDIAGVHSRPPHAFEIDVAGEAPWRLVLALTHTSPSSAEAEVQNFPDVLSWMRSNFSRGSRGDLRLAIVGDFNADGGYFKDEEEWPDSQLGPEWAGYSLLIGNDVDTTVADNDHTYDRIIADATLAEKAGPPSVFSLEDMDLSEVLSEGCRDGYVPSFACQQSLEGIEWVDVPPAVKKSLAKELSDHNPIEICLRG